MSQGPNTPPLPGWFDSGADNIRAMMRNRITELEAESAKLKEEATKLKEEAKIRQIEAQFKGIPVIKTLLVDKPTLLVPIGYSFEGEQKFISQLVRDVELKQQEKFFKEVNP